MKIVMSVKINCLEDFMNRQIVVDDRIDLSYFCQSVLKSMNASDIIGYSLRFNVRYFYPFCVDENNMIRWIKDLKLASLPLKVGRKLILNTDINDYFMEITVDEMIKEAQEPIFQVVAGNGYGIIDEEWAFSLQNTLQTGLLERLYKSSKKQLEYGFNKDEINQNISDYLAFKENQKNVYGYVLNISLKDFEKEIKRKIQVESNMLLDDFCKVVVLSMHGDLSHLYGIKIRNKFLQDNYLFLNLKDLNLEEKSKFLVNYDFGDDWYFKVSVSKVITEPLKERCEVLAGKGYGIVEDCGGTWRLGDIFDGLNTDWDDYDINEFDLEKCNQRVKRVL